MNATSIHASIKVENSFLAFLLRGHDLKFSTLDSDVALEINNNRQLANQIAFLSEAKVIIVPKETLPLAETVKLYGRRANDVIVPQLVVCQSTVMENDT